MHPLPYSPAIETVPDGERETIAGIVRSMTREGEIVTRRRGGHAVRVSHAKSTGAVRGRMEIAPGPAARAGAGPVRLARHP